jgi:hypothetical protein
MTMRTFGRMLSVWMYLSLCGSAILLAHNGPHGHFWTLMMSAAVCWLALGEVHKSQSNS